MVKRKNNTYYYLEKTQNRFLRGDPTGNPPIRSTQSTQDAIELLKKICFEMFEYVGKCGRFQHLMFYGAETTVGKRYLCKDLNGHAGSQLKGYIPSRRKLILDKSFTVSDDDKIQPIEDKHESNKFKTIDKKDLKSIPIRRKEAKSRSEPVAQQLATC